MTTTPAAARPPEDGGATAERLGLSGKGHPEEVPLAARHPDTGEEWKARRNYKVLGFDLTFSAPKASVPLALGDERIQTAVLAAHEHAVAEALAHV